MRLEFDKIWGNRFSIDGAQSESDKIEQVAILMKEIKENLGDKSDLSICERLNHAYVSVSYSTTVFTQKDIREIYKKAKSMI